MKKSKPFIALHNLLLACLLMGAMASCGVTRYLPEGEKFYNGALIILQTDSLSKKTKKNSYWQPEQPDTTQTQQKTAGYKKLNFGFTIKPIIQKMIKA